MKPDELKLIDVKKENLELVLGNLSIAKKVFNNADFITPTDLQIIVIKTVNYYKVTLWDSTIDDFNKDLLFSCIFKDTKDLNEKWLKVNKINSILETIIIKVWDENSNFTKKWESVKNIIKYFEFLKYSWVLKEEAIAFIDGLELLDDPKPTGSPIDDEMEALRKVFDDFNPFGWWFSK